MMKNTSGINFLWLYLQSRRSDIPLPPAKPDDSPEGAIYLSLRQSPAISPFLKNTHSNSPEGAIYISVGKSPTISPLPKKYPFQ
jgi:hypothetical protein